MSGDEKRGRDERATGDKKPVDRDLGHALRSVYGATVKEEIPQELLDLLGKLD